MQKLTKFQLLAGVAIAAVTPHAYAQDEVGNDENNVQVRDEIIVTSRFREESVQDIGAAVTGIKGEDIARNGLDNFDDIARTVVGINNVRTRQNSNAISIRGVSNDLGFLFASSNVFSFYVDDIAVTSATSQRDFGSADLDRVEIVRGPQPTLFGEGAVGGVIRYFTADPDLDGPLFSGTARGTIENIHEGGIAYRVDNGTSVVLVPGKLAIRLSGFYVDDDGFIDNRLSGEEDANGFDSIGGRAVLLAQPSDNLEIRLSAFLARDDFELDNNIEVGTNPKDFIYGLAGFADGMFPDFIGSGEDDFNLYSGRITYDAGAFEITSITGYYDRTAVSNALSIGNTLGLAPFFPTIDTTTFGAVTIGNETFSQELRIVSQFDGPLNVTAGAYYRDRDQSVAEELIMDGLVGVSTPSTNQLLQTLDLNESKQYSGFAELTFDVTDRFRVIGGARYVSDTYTADLAVNEVVNFIPANAPWDETNPIDFAMPAEVLVQAGVPGPYVFKLRKFLPHGAFEYDLADNMMLYANVAKGARNGGTGQAIAALATAGDPMDPAFAQNFADQLFFDEDTVLSFDGGVKSTWFDGDFLVNLGLFYTKYKDTQITIAAPANNATNGPDQRLLGLELETVQHWSDSWMTFFNATLLDTEFVDDFTVVLGAGTDIEAGDNAVNAPNVSFSLGYQYEHPIGNGWNLTNRATFQYIGERFSDNQNFPTGKLNSLENLDMRLGVENDRIAVSLFAKNLLNDVEAVAKGVSSLGAVRDANGVALDGPLNSLSINRPRSYGVSLTLRY
ncbi:TonB-dependent receptor [Hyphococcus sp.]|uniref:TonB-dependent receptor n=1 Tax=Hyphococcus sp. TaxID=2038636 RepID=UPI003CCC1FAA